MSVRIVEGNLLEAKEEFIGHQCNCCTTESKFLAKQIFDNFPYANTYKFRTKDPKTRSRPGTVDIFGVKGQRKIINMYAQYYPGGAKYGNDTYLKRLEWFEECLNAIGKTGVKKLALPYNIGCGSAGGDWNKYFGLIESFTNKFGVNVTLYKLD